MEQETSPIILARAEEGNSPEPLKIKYSLRRSPRNVVEMAGSLQIDTGGYFFITTGPEGKRFRINTEDHVSEFQDFARTYETRKLILRISQTATELNFSHFGFQENSVSSKRKSSGEGGGGDSKRRKK
jgi:hypothetical protein